MPNPNEYEARIYNSGPGTMGAYYHQVLASAIAGLLAGSSQAQVHPEKPIYKYEKGYGVGRQV